MEISGIQEWLLNPFYFHVKKFIHHNYFIYVLIHFNFDNNVIIVIDLGIKLDNIPSIH